MKTSFFCTDLDDDTCYSLLLEAEIAEPKRTAGFCHRSDNVVGDAVKDVGLDFEDDSHVCALDGSQVFDDFGRRHPYITSATVAP